MTEFCNAQLHHADPLGIAIMLRWFVDVSGWSPSTTEFGYFLAALGHEDRSTIERFIQFDDRKRALASRLLQRASVIQVCRCKDSEVRIARTRGGKPFTTNMKPSSAPNFNFNVSHEVRGWMLPCICL